MNRKHVERALSVVLILSIWQVISMGVGKNLIFPSPISSFRALITILSNASSFKTILETLLRVFTAFFISSFFGILIGFLMYFYPVTKILFSPVLRIVQTTPVMSFIMLALLWIDTNYVAVFVGFLIGLPIMALSTYKGLSSISNDLLVMTEFFDVHMYKKFKYLYIPAIFQFVELAMQNTLSLTWKVCVASEVLSYPKFAIGSELINSKNLLETERLFAWTFVLIVIGVLSEYLLRSLLKVYKYRKCGGRAIGGGD